ncbi:fatty acyl-CoA reductase wat-like [Choristoneura fumiferana]|uniref:fatty acyl-CoA reductase wat-like n=1 Tax=Choristoneura fumiferana TaxID=7141 RepID=UPI003D157092
MCAAMDPALAKEVSMLARRRDVDAAAAAGDSPVQQFYRGAVVFLTGGSGFVGKHLVEKLLRTCDVERVYLLMRGKKGHSAQERLARIFQDPVYDTLHKCNPDFPKRVVAVEGDITKIRLGISDPDWKMLADQVTVIFHVAATTTFDEPLRVATLTNVRGTTQTLLLGKDCKNIKSFVHVSTAYSHATYGRISKEVREEFYDSPAHPDTIIDLVQQLSEEKLAAIKPQLVADWPNTYAFTKALAEEAVRTTAGDLPICIVRPAIVIGSLLEPSPGWVDMSSAYGPSGLVIGCGLGFVHTFMANDDSNLDLIPVDFVNNATIAAGWETAERRAQGDTAVKIYAVAPARNPINWRELLATLYSEGRKITTPRAIWYNCSCHTKYRALFVLLTWLLHFIPGYLADGALLLLGKKPKAVKLYRTAYNLSSVLAFYTCNEFNFDDVNLQSLQNNLSEVDRKIYNFDVTKMSWTDMLVVWAIGLRKYIVKDGLKDTEYAVRKQSVFKILNYILLALYVYAWYKLCTYAVWFVSLLC